MFCTRLTVRNKKLNIDMLRLLDIHISKQREVYVWNIYRGIMVDANISDGNSQK
jgi:hypothetical protein